MRYGLPRRKKYPLTNPEEIKTAEEYFHKYRHNFLPSERLTFLYNLTKAAEENGVELSKATIELLPNKVRPDWKDRVLLRGKYLSHEKQAELNNLVEEYQKSPIGLIPKLEEFDLNTGISKYWREVLDPVKSILMRGEEPSTIKLAEAEVSKDKLQKALAQAKQFFSEEYQDLLTIDKVGELSEPAKRLIKLLAK